MRFRWFVYCLQRRTVWPLDADFLEVLGRCGKMKWKVWSSTGPVLYLIQAGRMRKRLHSWLGRFVWRWWDMKGICGKLTVKVSERGEEVHSGWYGQQWVRWLDNWMTGPHHHRSCAVRRGDGELCARMCSPARSEQHNGVRLSPLKFHLEPQLWDLFQGCPSCVRIPPRLLSSRSHPSPQLLFLGAFSYRSWRSKERGGASCRDCNVIRVKWMIR